MKDMPMNCRSFTTSEDLHLAVPLMRTRTLSTLSSVTLSELKERKSREGSGILLEERQELLSTKESESAVASKLERTKLR